MTNSEFEAYFKDKSLPATVRLHDAITIKDVAKFVDSHFSVIKTYQGSKVSEPFKERLERLQEILET